MGFLRWSSALAAVLLARFLKSSVFILPGAQHRYIHRVHFRRRGECRCDPCPNGEVSVLKFIQNGNIRAWNSIGGNLSLFFRIGLNLVLYRKCPLTRLGGKFAPLELV